MGFRGAGAAIRLRRLLFFLRLHGLYDTAHSLEKRTGVSFDKSHLHQMLLAGRWAAALSYVRGFVKIGNCSREADTVLRRILLLRVMADLAAGGASALFERLYDSLHVQPDCQNLRRILLSMRSDRARASRFYHRLKPLAVQVILSLITNCPELKGKTHLPRCTQDLTNIRSLVPGLAGCSRYLKNKAVRLPAIILARSFLRKRPPLVIHEVNHSASVYLSYHVYMLHLRRLDSFLRRRGLHSTAHTLERESLVYLDTAHLQKLVTKGRWDAAWRYVSRFSELFTEEGGEGPSHHYTAFLRTLKHHAMLHYLACRGDEGGRAAKSLYFRPPDDAYRNKFPEMAKQHDLYRTMASPQARASLDWDDIKLTTLEKLQELLHLHPDIQCSLRMRLPQHTPTLPDMAPLGLRGLRRYHQRKRIGHKPAHEIVYFLLQKRLPSVETKDRSSDSGASILQPTLASDAKLLGISSSVATNKVLQPSLASDAGMCASVASTGVKRTRSQDEYCTGDAHQALDST